MAERTLLRGDYTAVRTFHQLVFDDRVETDAPVYTDPKLNELLARPDVLEIVAIASQVSGSFPLLNVQVEVSSDNRSWAPKNAGGPEISREPLSTSQQTMTQGRSSSTLVTSTFNRLKIWLDNSDSRACLRIYVTGRGEVA
jgi:hypothetical protein